MGSAAGHRGDDRDGHALRAADRQRAHRPGRPRRSSTGPRDVHPVRARRPRVVGAAPCVPHPQRRVPRTGRRAGGAGAAGPVARRRGADRLLRRAAAGRRHVGAALRHVVEGRRRSAPARPHRRRPRPADRVPPRRLPRHVAPGRPRAAAVVPVRSWRSARRRDGPRPADRAQPDQRRRLRLADPRPSARARRRPHADAAQGRPARADPDGRDRRQGRRRAGRAVGATRRCPRRRRRGGRRDPGAAGDVRSLRDPAVPADERDRHRS